MLGEGLLAWGVLGEGLLAWGVGVLAGGLLAWGMPRRGRLGPAVRLLVVLGWVGGRGFPDQVGAGWA
jgi:hypothetical protein